MEQIQALNCIDNKFCIILSVNIYTAIKYHLNILS